MSQRPAAGVAGAAPLERLKTRRDYLAVQRGGTRVHGRVLLVCALPRGGTSRRLGITASRRFGTAVRRNRFRRLVREVCRHHVGELPEGYDVVVIARPPRAGGGASPRPPRLRYETVRDDLVSALRRLRAGRGQPPRPPRAGRAAGPHH